MSGRLRDKPLVRRVTGYSAGSVIAAITSELAFAFAYGVIHSGTTVASAVGFVGGAIPNYFLNRRWAWHDRRGRSPRQEKTLYAAVSIATFVVSAAVTNLVDQGADSLAASNDWQIALVAAAYLGVSGVFFVVKFVLYELVVFTKEPTVTLSESANLAEGPGLTKNASFTKDPGPVGAGVEPSDASTTMS